MENIFDGCNKLNDSNILNIKKYGDTLNYPHDDLFSGDDDLW